MDPIGEAEWEPDYQAFKEDYNHDRGHVARLWNADKGRQGELPFAAQFYDPSMQDLHPEAEPASAATSCGRGPSLVHTLSGAHGEPEMGDGIPYAARFYDPTDQDLEQEERDSAYANYISESAQSPGAGDEIPFAARLVNPTIQDREAGEWAEEAQPSSRCVTPLNDAISGMGLGGTNGPGPTLNTCRAPDMKSGTTITDQLTVSDTDLREPDVGAPPDQPLVSEGEDDQGDQSPRQPANPQNLPYLGDPDENKGERPDHDPEGGENPSQPARDLVVSGPGADTPTNPYADAEASYNLSIWNERDPTQITHDSVVLGPDVDPAAQPLAEATPTSPRPDQEPEPPQRRGRTRGRRLFSGITWTLLALVSLTATTEAYIPVTPNGTTNQPGGPESVLIGLGGSTYGGTGWEEVTRVSCGLLLLLIPVIAKLTVRIQQLEEALDQKPTPAEPARIATPVSEPRPAPESDLTELTGRIQQLEEALALLPGQVVQDCTRDNPDRVPGPKQLLGVQAGCPARKGRHLQMVYQSRG